MSTLVIQSAAKDLLLFIRAFPNPPTGGKGRAIKAKSLRLFPFSIPNAVLSSLGGGVRKDGGGFESEGSNSPFEGRQEGCKYKILGLRHPHTHAVLLSSISFFSS